MRSSSCQKGNEHAWQRGGSHLRTSRLCTGCRCVILFLLLDILGKHKQVSGISDAECADYELPAVLWIGSAGVDGMDSISMPGYHGALEIGYNSMAAVKWFVDMAGRTDGIFKRSRLELKAVEVDYLSQNRSTSDNPRLALAHATKLVTDPEAEDKLIGIFGGVSSEESRAVQLVASTFDYSQISPVSEARELSDKKRYPTFNRAIAPAYRTAYVIIDLCKHFGWDQVGIINGDTLEDFEAVRIFQNDAKAWNISVAATVNAASDSREDMEELVHHMYADLSHIRIWVMFFPRDSVQTARFFSYAAGTPLMRMENMFVASGRMASFVYTMMDWLDEKPAPAEWKLNEQKSISETFEAMAGTISVTTSRGWGSKVYGDFVDGLNEEGVKAWLSPFFFPNMDQEVFDVFWAMGTLPYEGLLHSHASLTIDTFESFARAAGNMVDDGLACRLVGPHRNQTLLLEYIRALNFEGVSGLVQYDEFGDRVTDYVIQSIHFDTSKHGVDRMRSLHPEVVMKWIPGDGENLVEIPNTFFQWRDGSTSDTTPPPQARGPEDLAENGDNSTGSALLTVILSVSVVGSLVSLVFVVYYIMNKRMHKQSGLIRAGVLDSKLLDINEIPVHLDHFTCELDGSFLFRDVTIHALNTRTDMPPGSVLIKCQSPMTSFPKNQVIAVNAARGQPGCVEPPEQQNELHGGHVDPNTIDLRSMVLPVVQLTNIDHKLSTCVMSCCMSSKTTKVSVDEASSSNSYWLTDPILPGVPDELDADIEAPQVLASLTPTSKPDNYGFSKKQGASRWRLSLGRKDIVSARLGEQQFTNVKDNVTRLMRLRSPRLQPLLGMTLLGHHQATPAVVAEKPASGVCSLHDTLHTNATPLDAEVQMQLLCDMAEGLAVLHSQELPIVHPGMSPHNILLDGASSGIRAMLSQYGYQPVHGVTYGGRLQYAAPEVLAGEEPRPSSDMFTWAMIAIELLQRQKLYVGLDVGHVLTGVRDGRLMPAIRDPSETSIPGALMDLIMECAARNPRRRPAAPEVVSRMQEIQRRQSAAAAPSPRTEELMLSVFPAEIAKQLAEGKTVKPENHPEVTIFFSDIVGFTNISAQLSPAQVMDMLNRLYLTLDRLTAHHGLFKVETIGDAYMSVGNLHPKAEDHAGRVARFAQDAIKESSKIPVHDDRPDLGMISMRVGFHTGPVVASVVGNLNPRYCLFGDTVNTASRMESTSQPGRVHCSEASYKALKATSPDILCEKRTDLGAIKGKGKMNTYWVLGRALLSSSSRAMDVLANLPPGESVLEVTDINAPS